MPPSNTRFDKAIQNIAIAFIISGALVALAGLLWMREDIIARQSAYRYCLELQYSPGICYATVFHAPKAWEDQAQ